MSSRSAVRSPRPIRRMVDGRRLAADRGAAGRTARYRPRQGLLRPPRHDTHPRGRPVRPITLAMEPGSPAAVDESLATPKTKRPAGHRETRRRTLRPVPGRLSMGSDGGWPTSAGRARSWRPGPDVHVAQPRGTAFVVERQFCTQANSADAARSRTVSSTTARVVYWWRTGAPRPYGASGRLRC